MWRDTKVGVAIEGLGCATCLSFIHLSIPCRSFNFGQGQTKLYRLHILPFLHSAQVPNEPSHLLSTAVLSNLFPDFNSIKTAVHSRSPGKA